MQYLPIVINWYRQKLLEYPKQEKQTFARCKALQSVQLGEGVIRIEEGAFEHSGLKKITLPGTLSNVEKYAFDYCNLKTIVYNGDWKQEEYTDNW